MKCDIQETGVRAFLAIEISDAARARVVRLQERLRGAQAGATWVAPGSLHITLCFLGSVSLAKRTNVEAVMASCVSGQEAFRCELVGAGFFGPPRAPKVVWAGVREGADAITALQDHLAAGIRAVGIPLEQRPYSPHVTLARVRSTQNVRNLVACIREARDTRVGSFLVGRVVLMRSELTPDGPLYTVLYTAGLG